MFSSSEDRRSNIKILLISYTNGFSRSLIVLIIKLICINLKSNILLKNSEVKEKIDKLFFQSFLVKHKNFDSKYPSFYHLRKKDNPEYYSLNEINSSQIP